MSVLAMLFLACTGPLLTSPAMAEDARLTDIVVTNTRDHLLLYFTVTDCFTEDMRKAIDNGVIQSRQEMSDQDMYKLIFSAGLSTAGLLTHILWRDLLRGK